MTPVKRTSYATGLMAEALCRLLLRFKGYRILAARYKSPRGEIDIVAARGNIVAIIEVKARSSRAAANEAILPRQRQRLENAARDFLARYPSFKNHNVRFDIMLVTPGRLPHHIKDAWRPEA